MYQTVNIVFEKIVKTFRKALHYNIQIYLCRCVLFCVGTESLAKLFSLMDQNSPERVAFVSRALKWSTGGSGKLGHPKLHQLLAVILWKGNDLIVVLKFYLSKILIIVHKLQHPLSFMLHTKLSALTRLFDIEQQRVKNKDRFISFGKIYNA